MGRLLFNELSKVYHQQSWRIMVLLMLLAAIAVPVYARLNMADLSVFEDDDQGYFESKYSNAQGPQKEIYKSALDDIADLKEKGINVDGWREDYFDLYLRYSNTLNALRLIQQGFDINDVVIDFQGGMLIEDVPNYKNEDNYVPTFEFIYVLEEEGTGVYRADTVPFNKNDVEKYIDAVQPWYDHAKQLLYGGKDEFADTKIKDLNSRISEEQEQIKALSSNDTDLNERERHEIYIIAYQGAIKCWEAFKTCDPENEKWIADLEDLLIKRVAQDGSVNASVYSKETFYDKYTDSYNFFRRIWTDKVMSFDSYESYIEYMDTVKADYQRAVDMAVYAAENQVPTEYSYLGRTDKYVYNSSKYVMNSSFTVDLYVVMFFCVFLSAVIMANEYTSGSVRLLLIRPQPRWKILLSKLLCVWIFTAATLIVTFGLSFIATNLLCGWGDLGTQIVAFKNGIITTTSPLQSILRKNLLKFISMFGVSMLAFMLSIIAKRGLVSAAVGVLIFGFGQAAANFIRYLLYKLPFLKFTALPYIMNLDNTEYSPLARFARFDSEAGVSADFGLSLPTGIVIILFHTAVFVILSFIVFDRQQIKS